MRLTSRQVRSFHLDVYRFARTHTRRFPWRLRRTPYRVLVSEVMLQQTQALRVSPFFTRFLKLFPSVRALAYAQTREVISAWKGLGYNRRALNLKRAAEIITSDYRGKIPCDVTLLMQLPGIGSYTASAVMAFAFNRPVVCIETNIRTVFIDRFFKDTRRVRDQELLVLIEQTLDRENPRAWYEALMDFGVYLKSEGRGHNARSAHYVRQKPFKGSRRELRGKLLSWALSSSITKSALVHFCQRNHTAQRTALGVLHKLASEGFFPERRIRALLKRK